MPSSRDDADPFGSGLDRRRPPESPPTEPTWETTRGVGEIYDQAGGWWRDGEPAYDVVARRGPTGFMSVRDEHGRHHHTVEIETMGVRGRILTVR